MKILYRTELTDEQAKKYSTYTFDQYLRLELGVDATIEYEERHKGCHSTVDGFLEPHEKTRRWHPAYRDLTKLHMDWNKYEKWVNYFQSRGYKVIATLRHPDMREADMYVEEEHRDNYFSGLTVIGLGLEKNLEKK